MDERGDIDWRRVKEIHDQWEYSHSGMGGVLAIVIAIVVAVLTYGAASQAIGAAAAGTSGTATATVGAATTTTTATTSAWAMGGWANAAASAGLAGMAGNTAVQLGTTGGVDWSQVFKTGAVSALTAGLTNYGFFEGGQSLNSLARLSAAPAGASGASSATGGLTFSWDQVYGVMGRGIVNAGVSSAIHGTDFKDAFIGSVVGDYAALSASSIGSAWGNGQNPVMQTLAHAALGASAAHLTGGDAAAGAIGGLVEAGLDNTVGAYLRESGTELDQWGRLAYLAGSTLAGGVAAEAAGHDGVTGAQAAQNAAQNNFLSHQESAKRLKLRAEQLACGDATCRAEKQAEIDLLNLLDAWRDEQIERACRNPGSGECQAWSAAIQIAARSYDGHWGNAVDLAERSTVQQQAFKYQQTADNPFLHGVGTGLLKLTPPGLVVGAVGGVAALVQSVVDNGATQTLIDGFNAITDFPADLKARLNSDDPAVRGEALVDAVTLGLGGTAITAGGVRLTVNAAQKAALGRELAKAEAEAIAKARVENNFYAEGGKADPTKPMSATGNWTAAAELSPAEASRLIDSRLPGGVRIVETEAASALNATVLDENPSYSPPYVPGTQTVTIQTAEPASFVRVYVETPTSSQQAGNWLFRAEDVAGLSAEQIASKYALPQIPTMATDVTVPAGQQLRVSIANDVQIKQGIGGNGGGGGVQFEVLLPSGTQAPSSWFTNPRPLE